MDVDSGLLSMCDYKMRRIVLFLTLMCLSLSLTACKKEPVAKIAEEVDASTFTYTEEATITLIQNEEKIDLSGYAKKKDDGYEFNVKILTDIFGFEKGEDLNGFARYDDAAGNRLMIEEGDNYILSNNEPVGVSGTIEKIDGEYYLPSDFFLALPDISGVTLRRDDKDLYIYLT